MALVPGRRVGGGGGGPGTGVATAAVESAAFIRCVITALAGRFTTNGSSVKNTLEPFSARFSAAVGCGGGATLDTGNAETTRGVDLIAGATGSSSGLFSFCCRSSSAWRAFAAATAAAMAAAAPEAIPGRSLCVVGAGVSMAGACIARTGASAATGGMGVGGGVATNAETTEAMGRDGTTVGGGGGGGATGTGFGALTGGGGGGTTGSSSGKIISGSS